MRLRVLEAFGSLASSEPSWKEVTPSQRSRMDGVSGSQVMRSSRDAGQLSNTALSTFLPRSRQAGGSSSVGRARPFQGRCRGFETRLPLSHDPDVTTLWSLAAGL